MDVIVGVVEVLLPSEDRSPWNSCSDLEGGRQGRTHHPANVRAPFPTCPGSQPITRPSCFYVDRFLTQFSLKANRQLVDRVTGMEPTPTGPKELS